MPEVQVLLLSDGFGSVVNQLLFSQFLRRCNVLLSSSLIWILSKSKMADNLQSPTAGAGGFVVPSLPSPAPSATSIRSVSGLPHPRGHALRPGSAKEDKVRNFVSQRMLHISRRFVKKSGLAAPGDDVVGYKSMAELCKDAEGLIDIIWLSGTRKLLLNHVCPEPFPALTAVPASLQIPYLLNVASEFNTWVPAFTASPRATFSLLRKLDHCFASLLCGQDIETKESLPGFENGLRAGMSRTDMVRCKSIVEQTRILIVDVMSQEPDDEEDGAEESEPPLTADEAESDRDGPMNLSNGAWDEDEDRLQMDVARVYEHTLVQLGQTLGEGGGVGDIQISDD